MGSEMCIRDSNTKDCLFIYFDSSSFSDSSFKSFIWSIGSAPTSYLNESKISGSVSLLMATTNHTIINYWIVNKVNSITTASFLYETVNHCRATRPRQRIIIFMDNARIHLTPLIKNLAHHLKVYFILNAPYSCKINQIEYVFELIKRQVRLKRNKTSGKSLAKFIRKLLIPLHNVLLLPQTRKTRFHILKSILLKDMWKRPN